MLQVKLLTSVYGRSVWCACRVRCVNSLTFVDDKNDEEGEESKELEAYLWKLFVYVIYMFRSESFFFFFVKFCYHISFGRQFCIALGAYVSDSVVHNSTNLKRIVC